MKRVLDIPVETRRAASPAIGKNVAGFRRAVLGWYDQHRRDLPWRKTRDPYRIWLSEIMLQQTRVAAVLEYYRVFLERFPNVEVLAAASEAAVLAAWSGLGYYRRARMLHRCARQIAAQHGGCFPRDSEALLALPGIGRYTAAAIASIAFSEPVAVVDGNVERVLQRLIGNKSIGINLTTAQTWQHAQALLANSRPGDFNQGMMELGATVCVPRAPHCAMCPVRKWCVTRGEVPHTEPPSLQKKKQIWCALEWRDGSGSGAKSGWCNARAKPRSCPACGNCPNHPSLRVDCRRRRAGARFAIPLPSPTTRFMCYEIRGCGMRHCQVLRPPRKAHGSQSIVSLGYQSPG